MSMLTTAVVQRARNLARLGTLRVPARNGQLIRQYATKITEPKKKTSTLKLLVIGVSWMRMVEEVMGLSD